VDVCICLLTGMYSTEASAGLLVGDHQAGYIVVPFEPALVAATEARCLVTSWPVGNEVSDEPRPL
jgi:predicted RNase H-like nuclease